jgi:hypothetical protein
MDRYRFNGEMLKLCRGRKSEVEKVGRAGPAFEHEERCHKLLGALEEARAEAQAEDAKR